MSKIKKNDKVIILVGKDKGKVGTVSKILTENNKLLVQGINIYKKNVKPNPQLNEKGGIVDKEMPLHISNVALFDDKIKKPIKVGYSVVDSKKIRINKKTNLEV